MIYEEVENDRFSLRILLLLLFIPDNLIIYLLFILSEGGKYIHWNDEKGIDKSAPYYSKDENNAAHIHKYCYISITNYAKLIT